MEVWLSSGLSSSTECSLGVELGAVAPAGRTLGVSERKHFLILSLKDEHAFSKWGKQVFLVEDPHKQMSRSHKAWHSTKAGLVQWLTPRCEDHLRPGVQE